MQAILCTGGTGIFQRHNFEGIWTLAENEEISGGHPHYEHRTPNGQVVHLFHVNSAYGGAPRWVIGPMPGNENGWGFVDTSGLKSGGSKPSLLHASPTPTKPHA